MYVCTGYHIKHISDLSVRASSWDVHVSEWAQMKQRVECPDEVESPDHLSAWTNMQHSLNLLQYKYFQSVNLHSIVTKQLVTSDKLK